MVIKSISDLKKKEEARRKARESNKVKIKDSHINNNYKFVFDGDKMHLKNPKKVGTKKLCIPSIQCPSCGYITNNINKKQGDKFECRCGASVYLNGNVLKNKDKV